MAADYFSGTLLIPEAEVKDAYVGRLDESHWFCYNKGAVLAATAPLPSTLPSITVKEIAQKVIDQGGFTMFQGGVVVPPSELGLLG